MTSAEPSIAIVRVGPHETDSALRRGSDEVLGRAYGSPTRAARIDRYIAVDHGAWFAAVETPSGPTNEPSRVLACGGALGYPSGGFGWIGLVATDPIAQRRGLAAEITRACMTFLEGLGCAPVLDASSDGAPLYRKLGYTDHFITSMMRLPRLVNPVPAGHYASPVSAPSLAAVIRRDRDVFGADRSALLGHLVRHGAQLSTVENETGLRGYVMRVHDVLGPGFADDLDTVKSLVLGASAAAGAPLVLCVPGDSQWSAALVELGAKTLRTVLHQRHGITQLPGDRRLLFAQTSFGEG